MTKYQKADAPNLYPEELRNEIDRLNDLLYEEINAGVYKCGFAVSQEAYQKAYYVLFSRLDWLEDRLSKQKIFVWQSNYRCRYTVIYHFSPF